MRRAYKVDNTVSYDPCSAIVFADSPSKAKSAAHNTHGFDCEWTELRATRYPEADKYEPTHEKDLVSWDSKAGIRIYYELEWNMNECSHCDWCYRFEDDSIPESILQEHESENVCKGCLEETHANLIQLTPKEKE